MKCCSRRKKSRSRCRPGKTSAVVLAVFAAVFISVVCLMHSIVGPNIEETARIKATAIVSRTVNQALAEELEKINDGDSLFDEKRNSSGTLEMVQADSVRINMLMSQLSMNIQDRFSDMGREDFQVSLGTLLGSRVLSQTGPYVTVTVVPMSVSSMDFKTEFETQGINQTKYKIYVILECRVKMLAPFSTGIFKTKNTVLAAETVILGSVPDSYVQVPKDDILDAT